MLKPTTGRNLLLVIVVCCDPVIGGNGRTRYELGRVGNALFLILSTEKAIESFRNSSMDENGPKGQFVSKHCISIGSGYFHHFVKSNITLRGLSLLDRPATSH